MGTKKLMISGNDCYNDFPLELIPVIQNFANLGYEFIISGKGRISKDFQLFFEGLGLQNKVTLYELKDNEREIKSNFNKKSYLYKVDEENKKAVITCNGNIELEIEEVKDTEQLEKKREFYSFIDERLIEECDEALIIWNGDTTVKRMFSMIQSLNLSNKKIYSIIVNGVPQ